MGEGGGGLICVMISPLENGWAYYIWGGSFNVGFYGIHILLCRFNPIRS